MKLDKNPRILAGKALVEVLYNRKPLKEVLGKFITKLSEKDKVFFHELLYGTVRHLLYLDWRINFYLARPEKLGKLTLANLRLGAYQILKMRVPEWAAVNETVQAEKITGKNDKVVNAVLRRIAEYREDPPLPTDTIKRLSIVYSHPEWLVKRYIERFGIEDAEAILRANNIPPPITLRVNNRKISREEFLKKLNELNIDAKATVYSPYGVTLHTSIDYKTLLKLLDISSVQDEAAQLVVLFLEPEMGKRILDACAAPGGKTSFIYELTEGKAKIIAVDKNPMRLKLLRQVLPEGAVDIIQSEIEALSFAESFDRIMLDAPCSSLGVIRRNPDVKFHVSPERLNQLQEKQLELLEIVSRFLSPGGILVYSVCSIEPEETVEVLQRYLNKNSEFYIIKNQPREYLRPFVNKEGFFYTFPHRHNMDGHFAVRIGKKK